MNNINIIVKIQVLLFSKLNKVQIEKMYLGMKVTIDLNQS